MCDVSHVEQKPWIGGREIQSGWPVVRKIDDIS